MKVEIYGGRVGYGEDWREEFLFDDDSTEQDIETVAEDFSADFMDYVLADAEDGCDFWYDWEVTEGGTFNVPNHCYS